MKRQQAATLLEQGLRHQEQGDLAAARAKYGKALTLDPANPDAWYLDGLAAHLLDKHDTAVEHISRALAIRPDHPFYHLNLGNALQSLGRKDDSEQAFRRSIALAPNLAAAHNNLGNLLLLAGRDDEAIACFDRTLVVDPTHVGAAVALAGLLLKRSAIGPAFAVANRALAQRPDDPKVLKLVTAILFEGQRYADAIALIDRALLNNPDDLTFLTTKGKALYHSDRFSEALAVQQKALKAHPDDPIASSWLAATLAYVGRPDESIAILARAIEKAPTVTDLYSQYLFFLNYSSRIDQPDLLAAHRAWDSRNESWRSADIQPIAVAGRRLRIGFVSGDFREHSVAWFCEPVFEHLDRNRFELFAYSTDHQHDAVSQRISSRCTAFRGIAGSSDDEAIHLILADDIDILIDLSGHSAGNRLKIFARKPAPVQVTWLGYPNTTGLEAIDFRISDAIADPPGQGAAWNSETVLRLPDCFHCFSPHTEPPLDRAPPVSRSGSITFVSFNIVAKISDPVLAAWAEILSRIPGSRLLLKSACFAEKPWADLLRARAAAAGIDSCRIELRGRVPNREAHLSMYREADIALDTFPYNGTTTTCEALWMGVPVVSLLGDRHSARVGASLLGALRHPELVAGSIPDYIDRAVALAGDHQRLAELHANLREEMRASPLMDGPRFARHFGAALEEAWRLRCEESKA